jgi:hypothetical protein
LSGAPCDFAEHGALCFMHLKLPILAHEAPSMKPLCRHGIRGLFLLFATGLPGVTQLEAQRQTAPPPRIARERFVPSADGMTVHDALLHVTWLADANYPATQKFGLPIKAGGAMTYAVARRWVAALNASNGGAGYLGRNNWTLPSTPATDGSCSVAKGPNGNSFGFDCVNSPMGSLYYRGFGLRQPNTAVPIPPAAVGPFKNLQPYLYWYATGRARGARALRRDNGNHTFSFNNGWQGGNVSNHVMYVLPMIPGPLPGAPPASGMNLQPSADGQTVYDPIANVTWLANANLAAEMQFGVPDIVPDGAMSATTADAFIAAMNRYDRNKGYLGQTRWELPPANPDPNCTNPEGGYNCSGSPMGGLYYNHLIKILGVAPGDPVVRAPDIAIGPFHNIQPYLHWSCAGDGKKTTCSGSPAAPGFQWSFSFGNGFQGTDVIGNSLHVMVYSPDPEKPQ